MAALATPLATELLRQPGAAETLTAHRTQTEHQGIDGTSGEVHGTGSTSTLPAYRRDPTGGDPGSHGSGAHLEVLDDLRDRH
jgi:hypothetical protein